MSGFEVDEFGEVAFGAPNGPDVVEDVAGEFLFDGVLRAEGFAEAEVELVEELWVFGA